MIKVTTKTQMSNQCKSKKTWTEPRRSTRSRQNVERLEPKLTGKSYHQSGKTGNRVQFKDEIEQNLEYCHNLKAQVHPNPEEDVEYASTTSAMMIARDNQWHQQQSYCEGRVTCPTVHIEERTESIFGERGHAAASKEMDQLHRRNCFTPISIVALTPSERRKAMEVLMFLTKKWCKEIKGCMVYNGKPTWEWVGQEDSSKSNSSSGEHYVNSSDWC